MQLGHGKETAELTPRWIWQSTGKAAAFLTGETMCSMLIKSVFAQLPR